MTSDLLSRDGHTDSVTLPSDQDASGRTLGVQELRALAAVITSGTLTGGVFVRQLEDRFAQRMGRACHRLQFGDVGHPQGGRGNRPRAG